MQRETFLSTVTAAVACSRLPELSETDPGGLVPDLSERDPVDLFCDRLAGIDGVVHSNRDPVDVIAEVVRAHGARTYLSWDSEWLPFDSSRLAPLGLDRIESAFEPGARSETQAGYMEVDLGITGAEAGFAESGSIVVRSGPGRPRMASLVAPVHVAVLERSAVYRSLAHWSTARADSISDAANVVFISGPSRTGDIEQELTLGVHGPKHLHVVLI